MKENIFNKQVPIILISPYGNFGKLEFSFLEIVWLTF